MRFLITTPVYNGAAFIDETIASVLLQAGAFQIRYHVQDGGSTDGTLAKLEAWKHRIAADFPQSCEGLEFTYASGKDSGLYDAVNKGFAACGEGDVMAWINADDRIEAGAFAAVSEILATFSSVRWLCGRGAILAESGAVMAIRRMIPFTRKGLSSALYEGRFDRDFVMQECCFWRKSLWDEAGGLDATYRLAGDFDLWRRFAAITDLVVTDPILGYFRLREGQLSGDLAGYHQEIDRRLSEDVKARRGAASFWNNNGIVGFRRVERIYKKEWDLKSFLALRLAGVECIRLRWPPGKPEQGRSP